MRIKRIKVIHILYIFKLAFNHILLVIRVPWLALQLKNTFAFVLFRDAAEASHQKWTLARDTLLFEFYRNKISKRKSSRPNKLQTFIAEQKLPNILVKNLNLYHAYKWGEFEKYHKISREVALEKREAFLNSPMRKSGSILLSGDFFGAFGHLALGLAYVRFLKERSEFSDVHFFRANSRSLNTAFLKYFDKYVTNIPIESNLEKNLTREAFGDSILEVDYIHLKEKSFYGFEIYNYLVEELHENNNKLVPVELMEEELSRLSDFKRSIGMNDKDWFVALHVRHNPNPAYSAPNANIEDYKKAASVITKLGGFVIRLGNQEMPKIDWGNRVFDYAHSQFKNASLDIALLGSCRFLIGTASGPMSFPSLFGVPVLYTNAPLLGFSYRQRGLYVPQLLFDKKTNQYLTISDSIKSRLAWTTSDLSDGNVVRVPNSAELIESSVKEIISKENNLDQALNSAQSDFLQEVNPFGRFSRAIPSDQYLYLLKEKTYRKTGVD